MIHGNTFTIDLKKCADPSPQGFAKSSANYGYFRQQAFYEFGHSAVFGEDLERFRFIAIGDEAPYPIGVYQLDATAVELGRQQIRKTLSEIAECYATGVWRHKWEMQTNELSLPFWARTQDQWEY